MHKTLFQRLQPWLILTGRMFLGAVFLMTAAGHLAPNFTRIAGDLETLHVPMPSVTLVCGIVFLIAGSLSIIIGFWARIGAVLLFIFLGLSCCYIHTFWKFEGNLRKNELIHFLKNLALMGAMVSVMAYGSGPLSVDAWRRIRQPMVRPQPRPVPGVPVPPNRLQ